MGGQGESNSCPSTSTPPRFSQNRVPLISIEFWVCIQLMYENDKMVILCLWWNLAWMKKNIHSRDIHIHKVLAKNGESGQRSGYMLRTMNEIENLIWYVESAINFLTTVRLPFLSLPCRSAGLCNQLCPSVCLSVTPVLKIPIIRFFLIFCIKIAYYKLKESSRARFSKTKPGPKLGQMGRKYPKFRVLSIFSSLSHYFFLILHIIVDSNDI